MGEGYSRFQSFIVQKVLSLQPLARRLGRRREGSPRTHSVHRRLPNARTRWVLAVIAAGFSVFQAQEPNLRGHPAIVGVQQVGQGQERGDALDAVDEGIHFAAIFFLPKQEENNTRNQ